ncbi:glycosyltransferase [Thalassotalea psychrophila]|uniref:glycosyltransferase n=1 Tax=Thalassotalea psychrophila TaxID=3065647 RepID=UPI0038648979
MVEALACGTPCVVVTLGGMPELISTEHTGKICAANTLSVNEAIQVALNNEAIPCFSSSCSEVYLVDTFDHHKSKS